MYLFRIHLGSVLYPFMVHVHVSYLTRDGIKGSIFTYGNSRVMIVVYFYKLW